MKKIALLFFVILHTTGFSQIYQSNIQKADSLYYKKEYKEALRLYEEVLNSIPNQIDESFYYNAACIAALDGQLEKAEAYLKKSIEKGWIDIDHLQKDEDLAVLRQRPQWKQMIESIESQFKEAKIELAKIKGYKTYELVPFKKGKYWGYLHYLDTKKVIVKPIFDTLTFFYREQAQAVYNLANNIVIKVDGTFNVSRELLMFNDEQKHFKAPKSVEESAALKRAEKFQQNSHNELRRLEAINDRAFPYGSQVQFFFYEKTNGEKGLLNFDSYLDTIGTKYLVNQIDSVFSFHKEDSEDADKRFEMYAAAKNGKWGIINYKLNWEIQPKYDEIKRCKRICDGYCEGGSLYYGFYFLVREGDKIYYIDRQGKRYTIE